MTCPVVAKIYELGQTEPPARIPVSKLVAVATYVAKHYQRHWSDYIHMFDVPDNTNIVTYYSTYDRKSMILYCAIDGDSDCVESLVLSPHNMQSMRSIISDVRRFPVFSRILYTESLSATEQLAIVSDTEWNRLFWLFK